MDSDWTIPAPEEVRQRATEVRKTWSPAERLARLNLPPDSVLLRKATPKRHAATARRNQDGREKQRLKGAGAARSRIGSR
jgi:hypothetical protein